MAQQSRVARSTVVVVCALDDAPGADVVVVPSGRVVCVVVEVEDDASVRTPCQSVPVTT
jgi:hypothetical protein